jgi:GDP-mannose transporter
MVFPHIDVVVAAWNLVIYVQAYTIHEEPALLNPVFVIAAIISSLLAISISFASLWFLSTTTATIYSLVGSLNKIPVAILGLVAFNIPWNPQNLASILLGLAASVVFVKAKHLQ